MTVVSFPRPFYTEKRSFWRIVAMVTSPVEHDFSSWTDEAGSKEAVWFFVCFFQLKNLYHNVCYFWPLKVLGFSCSSLRASSDCMIVSGSAPSPFIPRRNRLFPWTRFTKRFQHPGQASRARMATWPQRWETALYSSFLCQVCLYKPVWASFWLFKHGLEISACR